MDLPSAPLAPDSVRVQVSGIGINFADVQMRMGLYPEAPKPPFVPGFEVAGTVTEVGAEVTSAAPRGQGPRVHTVRRLRD